jgi:hypothetical protein
MDDYFSIDFGCNGTTGQGQAGTPTNANSTCYLPPNNDDGAMDCGPCPEGSGPGDKGCYFLPGAGSCNLTSQGYWSSTRVTVGELGFDPKDNTVFWYPIEDEALPYRCATPGP